MRLSVDWFGDNSLFTCGKKVPVSRETWRILTSIAMLKSTMPVLKMKPTNYDYDNYDNLTIMK